MSTKRLGKDAGKKCGNRTMHVRSEHTDADQRKHIRRAIHERLPHPHEEWPPAPQYDRCRQSEFNQRKNAAGQPGVERVGPKHPGHGEQKKRQSQRRTHPQAARHVDKFRIRFSRDNSPRLERHPADRASARFGPDNLRMHGTRVFNAFHASRRRFEFQRHSAFGTTARPALPDFQMHRANVSRVGGRTRAADTWLGL